MVSRRILAQLYVWICVIAGAAVLCNTAAHWRLHDVVQFASYLLTGMIASGLKIQFPGVTGTASVGFLFVFIGIIDLSAPDAIFIAAGSMLVQCLWRPRQHPRPIQTAWSVASISVCTWAAAAIFDWVRPRVPEPVALALVAFAFFAAATFSLAAVIALHEGSGFRTVLGQQKWLLPYYVCGASLAWLIGNMPRAIQWEVPIICLPVIYLIHRTYEKHLRQMEQEKIHAEEVSQLHLRTIETLAAAIDARDHTTHDHLQRVRVYAIEVGKELGLTPGELDALRAASVLHDIGKLAVPEHILSKPGKLTPAEFEKIKVHPVVGAEIVERVGFPYPVTPVVHSHHERWDGTGYPDGLSGEQIPMGARILSAVDCLDALASDRQYRRALPLDEAMAKIAAESGSTFDPAVIGVLKRRYRELEVLAKAANHGQRPLSTEVTVRRGAPAAGFAAGAAGDLRRLSGILQAMPLEGLSVPEAYNVIAARLEVAAPYDALAVFIASDDVLRADFTAGPMGELFAGLAVPFGEGLTGWVAASGQSILNGNPQVEPGYPVAGAGLHSACAVPAGSAVFCLYRRGADAFTRADLAALTSCAAPLAPMLAGRAAKCAVRMTA